LRRFFVQNIFFLVLVNLIVKPVWIFGIDRNVQNMVGHTGYGTYQALFNLSLIFQTLLDFGLQSYNTRTVAQSPVAMKKLFPNIMITKAILSLVYLIVVMVTGLLLGYKGFTLNLLLALSFAQALNSMVLYLRSNVSAMHHFKTDSILSVMDRLFMIGICSVLLFYKPLSSFFRIEWFVYAQITAYLLTAIIAFIICYRLTKFDWQHYDFRKILVICKKSLPYATLIFLMAIYMRSDAFLLERMLAHSRPEEAGVYAASFRLLDVVNNITGVLFAGILLPMFGRLLAKRESVQPVIDTSANLLFPVGITTTVTALFFGKEIMMALYHEAGTHDGTVLGILLLSFPFYCLSYVYATLLTANGNLKQLIFISFIAVLLSLSLNAVLIPHFGALGAGITSSCVQGLVAIINIIVARRLLHITISVQTMLRYLVFIILIVTAGYIIQRLNISPAFHLLFMAVSGGLSILLCGLISVRALAGLIKSKG